MSENSRGKITYTAYRKTRASPLGESPMRLHAGIQTCRNQFDKNGTIADAILVHD
jgi:hypothetical protein